MYLPLALRVQPRPAVLLAFAALLMMAPLFSAFSVCKAHAQSADTVAADLAFRVVDGTTGQGTHADRLTIAYLGVRQEPIIDIVPGGSAFVLDDVPLRERGRYIVAAWKDGVPYFFNRPARDLMAQEQTLHVFSTTTDRADVRISGMNLVLRRRETVVEFEVLLQIDNATKPQSTLHAPPSAFDLKLPDGVDRVEAVYHRGPDPISVPVTSLGDNRWGLDMGVVPGNNRIRLTAIVPWREGMEVPVGSNLALDAWSVLATPDWIVIDSRDLEPDPDTAQDNVKRMKGPVLDPGQSFRFILRGGEITAGATEEVFTTEAPENVDEEEEDGGIGGLPIAVVIALGVVIIAVVARRRR